MPPQAPLPPSMQPPMAQPEPPMAPPPTQPRTLSPELRDALNRLQRKAEFERQQQRQFAPVSRAPTQPPSPLTPPSQPLPYDSSPDQDRVKPFPYDQEPLAPSPYDELPTTWPEDVVPEEPLLQRSPLALQKPTTKFPENVVPEEPLLQRPALPVEEPMPTFPEDVVPEEPLLRKPPITSFTPSPLRPEDTLPERVMPLPVPRDQEQIEPQPSPIQAPLPITPPVTTPVPAPSPIQQIFLKAPTPAAPFQFEDITKTPTTFDNQVISPLAPPSTAPKIPPVGTISELPGPIGPAPTMSLPNVNAPIPRSPFESPLQSINQPSPQMPQVDFQSDLPSQINLQNISRFAPAPFAAVTPTQAAGFAETGPLSSFDFTPESAMPMPGGEMLGAPMGPAVGGLGAGEDQQIQAPMTDFAQSEKRVQDFMNSLSPEDRAALSSAMMGNLGSMGPINIGATPTGLPAYDIYPENLFTEGTGGKDLEKGDLYDQPSAGQFFTQAGGDRGQELLKQLNALSGPVSPELQAASDAMKAEKQSQLAVKKENYLSTLESRRGLSELLRQNKFTEAFTYAAENGLSDLIKNPAELKNLRDPFTKEEAAKFFSAIPSQYKNAYAPSGLTTQDFQYDPQAGFSYSVNQWRGDKGFPLVTAAFSAKPDNTVSKLVSFGIDAMLAAAGVPPLASGLTKAAYTLAATGGDVSAAIKSGAAAAIGAKIGEAITSGLPGTNLPALRKAAGVAEKQVASAITQGVGADALQEIVITALRPTLGTVAATAIASNAIDYALQDAPNFVKQGTEPDVEEVLVRGTKLKPDLQNGLASLVSSGVQDIFSDRQIAEMQEAEARDKAEAEQTAPEEEVKIEAKRTTEAKPESVVGPLSSAFLTQGFRKPEINPVTGEPEITVTAKKIEAGRPFAPDVVSGLDAIEGTEPPVSPDGVQEVTIEGKKPEDRGIVVTPPVSTETKPAETQPKKEEEKSGLAKLIEQLGGISNLLRLLGALGAATQGRQQPITAPRIPRPSSGGLPKYSFQRTALKPDIDYYTYGTRPEVPFFEDTLKLDQSAPDVSVVNPKDEPRFAVGGLAEGGESEEAAGRYVEGPGSGRDDKIPALLSDGEYVMDAETLALLGDGSTKEGARRMDDFRANIRRHKGRALSRGQISPDAKSPNKYMGGGLT